MKKFYSRPAAHTGYARENVIIRRHSNDSIHATLQHMRRRITLALIGIVCAILLAFRSPVAPSAADAEFAIRFGIVKLVGPSQFKLTQETAHIPKMTRSQGFLYGVEITPREETAYEVFFVAHLPAAPEQLSGLMTGTSPGTAVSGMKTPVQRVRGPSIMPFWFDEGDPLGRYSLEVFVNGQSRAVIKYDVIAPPRP